MSEESQILVASGNGIQTVMLENTMATELMAVSSVANAKKSGYNYFDDTVLLSFDFEPDIRIDNLLHDNDSISLDSISTVQSLASIMAPIEIFSLNEMDNEEDKTVVRNFSISKDGLYLVRLNSLAGSLPYTFAIFKKDNIRDTLVLSGNSGNVSRVLKLEKGDYKLVVAPLDSSAEGECRFSFPQPELQTRNITNLRELRRDYYEHSEFYLGGSVELSMLKEEHIKVGSLALGIDGAKVLVSVKDSYIDFKIQTSINVKFGNAKMKLDFSSGDNGLYMYSHKSIDSLFTSIGSGSGFDLVGECKVRDWTFHGYGLKSLSVKVDTRVDTYTIATSVSIMENVFVNGELSWKNGKWDSFSVSYKDFNFTGGLHLGGGVNLVSLGMSAKNISASSGAPLTLSGSVGLAYGKTITIKSNLNLIICKIKKGTYKLASLDVEGSWSTDGTIAGKAALKFLVKDDIGLITATAKVKYVPGKSLDVSAKFDFASCLTIDGNLKVTNDILVLEGKANVNFKILGFSVFSGEASVKFVSRDTDKTLAVYKDWNVEVEAGSKDSAEIKIDAGKRKVAIYSFRTDSWSVIEGRGAKEVYEHAGGTRAGDSLYEGCWEFETNATTGYFVVACQNSFENAGIHLNDSQGGSFDVLDLGQTGMVRLIGSREDMLIIAVDGIGGEEWSLTVSGNADEVGEIAAKVTYDLAIDALSLEIADSDATQIVFNYVAYSIDDDLAVSLYLAAGEGEASYFIADLTEEENGKFTWVISDDLQGMSGRFYLSVYGETTFPFESERTEEITLTKHFADVGVDKSAIVHSRYDNGISLTFDLTNESAVDADAFDVSVYLSADNEFNSSDVLLGMLHVNGISANGTLHRQLDVAIPQDLESDTTYYIGIVADMEGILDEYNWLENNTATITVDTDVDGTLLLPIRADVMLDGQMPKLEYMYGCTPTALAMLMGYYDLYGYRGKDFTNLIEGDVELNARGTDGDNYNMNAFDTVLGRFAASPEYIYRFYSREELATIVAEGPSGDYAATTPDEELKYAFVDGGDILDTSVWNCLADYIGTGQYWRGQENLSTVVNYSMLADIANSASTSTFYSPDKETVRTVEYKYTTMLYGLQFYVQSRGYSLDYEITGTYSTDNNGGTFTFEDYKAEIDAGRPVLIGIEEHSMVGYGYNADTGEIIFDDDYEEDKRMVWGQSYYYAGKERELQAITVIGLRTQEGECDLQFYVSPSVYVEERLQTADCFLASDSLMLDFTITNTGDDATMAFLIDVLVDGMIQQSIPVSSVWGSELLQYNQIELGKLSVGTHQVEVFLDAGNDVEEENGVNNRSAVTVHVFPEELQMLMNSRLIISSGQKVRNTLVAAYGSMVLDGGSAENIFLKGSSAGYSSWYGDAYLYINNGGVAKTVEAFKKSYVIVSSGGKAEDVIVHSGVDITVSRDGYVSGLTIESGYKNYNYGVISSLRLERGAHVYNYGGSIYNAIIDGQINYYGSNGGFLSSAIVKGYIRMSATGGAVASDIILGSKGSAYIYSGAVLKDVSGDGYLYASSGGVIQNAEILAGGFMGVENGGRTEDVVLHDWTSQNVYSGGTAVRTSAMGGCINVISGGVVSRALIGKGGSMVLSSGATASVLTVDQGGWVYAYGYISNSLTIGGRVQDISGEGIVGVSSYLFNVQTQMSDAFLSLSSGSIAAYSTITIDVGNAWGNYTLIKGDLNNLSTAMITVNSNGYSVNVSPNGSATFGDGRNVKLKTEMGSWTLTVSGIDNTSPQMPENLESIVIDNMLHISWQEVHDFSGVKYEVEYSCNADFSDSASEVVTTPKVEIALANGLWHWRVRAVDGAGNTSPWTTACETEIDYTKILTGALSQTQSAYSDVTLAKGTSIKASYPGGVQLMGDGFNVTLFGSNTIICSSIQNATILFGNSWGDYYYDGVVNFVGTNITLHSEVSNGTTAAGIRGSNLTVNFLEKASGAESIVFEAMNGSSGPGNYAAGVEAEGKLIVNGDFGGNISCVMDCRELSSPRRGYLEGFYAVGNLEFNGDMDGCIYLAGYTTNSSYAYGMRSEKNLIVNGDIGGIIMATAENAAYGLYGYDSITASISGIVFAGRTTDDNDQETLTDKLRHFNEYSSELLELSKEHYSIYTKGDANLILLDKALLIGNLYLSNDSQISIWGGAAIYGDVTTSYATNLQFVLDDASLEGTRWTMTSWNEKLALSVNADNITSDGIYALVGANDLSSVTNISLSVDGRTFNLKNGHSITVNGVTYSLENIISSLGHTLALAVSEISSHTSEELPMEPGTAPTARLLGESVRIARQPLADKASYYFFDDDSIYLSFNVINEGDKPCASFTATVKVDGDINDVQMVKTLRDNEIYQFKDLEISALNAGTHQIEVLLNYPDAVGEPSTNSSYFSTIQVFPSGMQVLDSRVTLSSGQVASNTFVVANGSMTLDGGSAENILLLGSSPYYNSATLIAQNGGFVEHLEAFNQGRLYVSSGGNVENVILHSNGNMCVYSGGAVSDVAIETGGGADNFGGIISNVTVNGGVLSAVSGGVIQNAEILSRGEIIVNYGGIVSNVTVSGGMLTAINNALIQNAEILSGGSVFVGFGCYNPTGGEVSSVFIGNGGWMELYGDTTACDLIIEQGGFVFYNDPLVCIHGSLTIGGCFIGVSGEGITGVSSYLFNVQKQSGDAFLSFSSGGIAADSSITIDVGNAWGDYTLIKGDLTNLSSATISVRSNEYAASISANDSVILGDGRRVKLTKGAGRWMLAVSGTDNTPPQPPTNLASYVIDNMLHIYWQGVKDFSGVEYQVEYSRNADFSKSSSEMITSSSVIIPLANGQWYWRVRSVDGAGNVSSWTSVYETVINYTMVLRGTWDEIQSSYSDVMLANGAFVNASYNAGLMLKNDSCSVTLQGNNTITCSDVNGNASILFGGYVWSFLYTVDINDYWEEDDFYDGTVNFYGANITLLSKVTYEGPAACIKGNNLTLNFTDSASGTDSIVFSVSNNSYDSWTPTNIAYGIYSGKNLMMNGDFGGMIIATANQTAYGLFGLESISASISGIVFAGIVTDINDQDTLIEKLKRFSENEEELLELSQKHYSVFTKGKANLTLGDDALLIGNLNLGKGSQIQISGSASVYGNVTASGSTALQFNLDDASLAGTRWTMSSWNSYLTISINADNIVSNGVYSLVEAKSLSSISTITLSVEENAYKIKAGNSMTVDGVTYELAKQSTSSGQNLTLTVSGIVFHDREAPVLTGQVKAEQGEARTAILSWVGATDNIGVDGYELKWDGQVVVLEQTAYYLENITLGTHTCQIRAFDEAGNYSDWTGEQEIVFVDTLAPILSGQIQVEHREGRTVTLSWAEASDNIGVAGYELKWDGRVVVLEQATYELTNIVFGPHTCQIRAFDEMGNYSNWSEEQEIVFVDTLAPVLKSISATPKSITNQTVSISVEYEDDFGSCQVQYRLVDDEKWQDYHDSVSVSLMGVVCFRAIDDAGNESSIRQFWVGNIDREAPEAPDATADILIMGNVDVTIIGVFTEDHAVRQYRIGLEGDWLDYTGNVVFTTNGTVFFRGQDEAGNYSEITSLQVSNIDRTMSIVPQIVDLADNRLHTVTVKNASGDTMIWSTSECQLALFGNTQDLVMQVTNGMEPTAIDAINLVSLMPKSVGDDPVCMTMAVESASMAFFARANSVWSDNYVAEHIGIGAWDGTGETAELNGKNAVLDIFAGSDDASILLLTDDGNGDALFIDDIYSAFPEGLDAQARVAKIDEIRAGAGDDIVDLTSQRFDYVGGGMTVKGGLGDDVIWANNGDNTLFGDAGNDRIVGAEGNDVIVGGAGDDSMHGGGGDDIFAFGGNWGNDSVEQLADGKVTLWFENGSRDKWNASTLTYRDGDKSVKVSGVTAEDITLKFGDDGSQQYDKLLESGAFDEFSSERIFEDKRRGMLA